MRPAPSARPPIRIARDTNRPSISSALDSHWLVAALRPAMSAVDPPSVGGGAAAAPNVTMTPAVHGTGDPFTRDGSNFILFAAARAALPNGVVASGAVAYRMGRSRSMTPASVRVIELCGAG